MTRAELREYVEELESQGEIPYYVYSNLIDCIDTLEQEPFMNKVCVSSKACEHDKEVVLDKIRAEIEKQEKWLLHAGYNTYNVDIAFNSIKRALAESEIEDENDD